MCARMSGITRKQKVKVDTCEHECERASYFYNKKEGPCCLFLTDNMEYHPFQTDSNWTNAFVQGKEMKT